MSEEKECQCGDGEGHFKWCPVWLYGSKKFIDRKEVVRTVDPYHLKIIESLESRLSEAKTSAVQAFLDNPKNPLIARLHDLESRLKEANELCGQKHDKMLEFQQRLSQAEEVCQLYFDTGMNQAGDIISLQARLSKAEADSKLDRENYVKLWEEHCNLMDVAEGLIWYSIDTDFHDNNPLQGIEHYKKYKKEFEDKTSPWYQRKHMGDCTQEPNSCATCQIEEIEKQVKLIAEWDGIKEVK